MKISNYLVTIAALILLSFPLKAISLGDTNIDKSPCSFINKAEIAAGASVQLNCPTLSEEAIKNLEKLIEEQISALTKNLKEQTRSLKKVNNFNDLLGDQIAELEAKIVRIQQERDNALIENRIDQQSNPGNPLLVAERQALEDYDLRAAAELREEYYLQLKKDQLDGIAREAFISAERWESAFNSTRALRLYQEAVEFKPDYPEAWRRITRVAKKLGQTQLALKATKNLKTNLDAEKHPKWFAIALNDEAGLLVSLGENAVAFSLYQKLQKHLSKLVETEPENTEWQRDLSVSYDRVGDMHKANGDGVSALKAYEDGLAIAKRLAELNPNIVQWQTDLVVSYYKLSQVQPDNSRELLGDALAILQRLHSQNRLDHERQGWIPILENMLDE